MDLTEISRKRVLIDTEIASMRILALSIQIESATVHLRALREELLLLQGPDVPAAQGALGHAGAASASLPRTARPRLLKTVRRALGLRPPTPKIRWHFDDIGGSFPPRGSEGVAASVSRNTTSLLAISGWIVPLDGQRAFSFARIVLSGPSGSTVLEGATYTRDDVAAHFANPDFAASGFRFDVPMAQFTEGRYAIEIAGLTPGEGEASTDAGYVDIR